MNGFIGTLAAQLAPQPVLPAADGIASRPRNAFPGAWRWRYVDVMRSQVSDDGNILPRCTPKKGLGREKGLFVAIYRRRVFKMSWLWQDMRAMYPKSPANRRWRIHYVNILPGRDPFRCTNPSNHARRADLATIQRSQGLAHGRQEELGIASALRIAADGPTTVVAHICGSRAQPRQLPLCGRWRNP